jgi:hypothetical protein
MTVYMVFEPPGVGGDPVGRAERTVFVRDRFSWGAFLLGPIWLAWRRLWLALLGYVVVAGLVAAGLRLAGTGANWRSLALALIGILLGLEAANLRRWALMRRGWRDLGIVIGDDLEAAERRFFDAHAARGAARPEIVPPPPSPPPVPPGPVPDVIGLFPQPGANR